MRSARTHAFPKLGRNGWLLLAVLLACLAPAPAAGAEPLGNRPALGDRIAPQTPSTPELRFLGYGRAISREWSASRDTPSMNMLIFPRPAQMAGGELSLFALGFGSFTLRSGFAGLIELEVDAKTTGVNSGPSPSGRGKILWRGSYAYYSALALNELGRLLCNDCELELTLQYRHESQHYTGGNNGGGDEDVSEQPYVGDDVIFDIALAKTRRDWYFAQRLIGMWFLPDRSSYAFGAGTDLHARFLGWSRVQPFLSLYGERLRGTELQARRFPDAYRLRALLGVALPSWLGEILVYAAADVGHRHGVRGLTEEATLGLGVRLAVGAGPGRPRLVGGPP